MTIFVIPPFYIKYKTTKGDKSEKEIDTIIRLDRNIDNINDFIIQKNNYGIYRINPINGMRVQAVYNSIMEL